MRKKPAPPPPSDQLIELLMEHDPAVGELALAVRSIMLEEAPAAVETVFKNYAIVMLYSLGGKWADTFCHIVVYSRHVNLGFNWGARLPDRNGAAAASASKSPTKASGGSIRPWPAPSRGITTSVIRASANPGELFYPALHDANLAVAHCRR